MCLTLGAGEVVDEELDAVDVDEEADESCPPSSSSSSML